MVLLALIALTSSLLSCAYTPGGAPVAGDLIAGLSPSDSSGVMSSGRINDGITSKEGDHWQTNVTAVLRGRGAHVTYDLGKVTPIGAIALKGGADMTGKRTIRR